MTPPVRIAIVGGGPRCLGLLDALGANAESLLAPGQRLQVHVFDPYPVGGGRVWRRDQPALLWMNTPVSTVTIFPDATSVLEGPVRPDHTLHEWVLAHRDELLQDDLLADEVRDLTGDTFASRPLQAGYLTWAFEHIVADRADRLDIVVHPHAVVDVSGDGPQTVLVEDGQRIEVDAVVLAQGHLDDELDGRETEYTAFAADHRLVYMPPAYTADCDIDAVPAGEPVIVNGMGLAFIDWMVLLGETRGGRFEPAGGALLTYHPSGREPMLYVGSRRGAAYHPKITAPLVAPLIPLPQFFTVDAVSARFPDPRSADFQTDLWPLACKELAYAHYAELFRGHPERVALPWEAFLARFAQLDYGTPAFDALVAESVPDPADRLSVAHIDRPFAEVPGGRAEKEEAVVALVEEHLRRMTDLAASVDTALARGFFSIYGVFGDLIRLDRLSATAVVHGVDRWLHGLFSHVTSGPPPERLAQLAAMHRAGVVRFLGDDTRVRADDATGRFAVDSASWGETLYADALIDARLPPADVRRTVDRLTRALVARGELTDRVNGLASGRIRVDGESRLLQESGTAHPLRWAVGPWVVGGGWANAFPKPREDAGFFRQNDALARSILGALARVEAFSGARAAGC